MYLTLTYYLTKTNINTLCFVSYKEVTDSKLLKLTGQSQRRKQMSSKEQYMSPPVKRGYMLYPNCENMTFKIYIFYFFYTRTSQYFTSLCIHNKFSVCRFVISSATNACWCYTAQSQVTLQAPLTTPHTGSYWILQRGNGLYWTLMHGMNTGF